MREEIVDLGRVEKVERMKPDPKLLELTEKIIEQNNTILEMNKMLIKNFACLVFFAPGLEEK